MRRAGRLEIGETATGAAVKAGRARIVCVAADAAENARKRAQGFLTGRRALYVELPYTKEQLAGALGKSGCSMAACTDFGLSGAFMAALAEAEPDRYACRGDAPPERQGRLPQGQRAKKETGEGT